jgi:hypothetical protein
MKKFFPVLLIFSFLISATSYAQLRKIPAEVTESFKSKYPEASDVEWRDKLKGFSADFKVNEITYTAHFSNKGEWESTEQQIEADELPDVVKDGFEKSKYSEWEQERVDKIELADDTIQYRIAVAKNDIRKRNLYFSSEGRLLKDKLTL